jgi:hypothetical protein
MRFHPKKAGIDGPCARSEHGQGGTEGSQQDIAPRIMGMRAGAPNLNDCQKYSAVGVHKPASSSIPAAIARTWITARLIGGALCSSIILRKTNAMPTTRRMSRRPAPGQP